MLPMRSARSFPRCCSRFADQVTSSASHLTVAISARLGAILRAELCGGAAAQEAAAVAHRILAVHACPVGERRARDDEGTKELGPYGREHHDGPSSLAIADHAGLAFGIGVQRDDLFKEHCFGVRNVLDRLARHGIGQEADEITGMPGLERDADLAIRLEPADPGAVPSSRINDNERPAQRIDLDARGRKRCAPGHN